MVEFSFNPLYTLLLRDSEMKAWFLIEVLGYVFILGIGL